MTRRLQRLVGISVALAAALAAPVSHAARPSGGFDAGFLASRHTDVKGTRRTQALGPFLEWAEGTNGWAMSAVRPFYSDFTVPGDDAEGRDILWPLATTRRRGDEALSRYGIFLRFRHGNDETPKGPRSRFWLVPFYFQGRDAEGDTYRAVFPLFGTLRDFLGRDEIRFVLFPIRSKSKLNDIETSNWLWPLIARTTGGDEDRFRVFPFYGRATRAGDYEKRFVLWPFWTQARYDYPQRTGGGFVLFPLYGRMKMEDQSTTWFLPPLFRFTRGEKMNLTYCPWPFFQKASGAKDKLYLWPIWGTETIAHDTDTFFLWPIFHNRTWKRQGDDVHRFMAIPLFYWQTRRDPDAPPGTPPLARSHKLWPVYSYKRDGDESRFRVLELWPFGESAPVERNWAPFWSLYTRETAGEGNRDAELLWGLYRNRARADGGRFFSIFPLVEWSKERDGGPTEWSILKGLIGGEREDSRRSWRLLYFLRFGGEEPAP